MIFKNGLAWGFGSTLGKNLSKSLVDLGMAYLKKKYLKEVPPAA